MLSRLQELKKEEETLLRVKAALQDQLNRLKVEEMALQSMIRTRETNGPIPCSAEEEAQKAMLQVDNEATINLTELQLSTSRYEQDQEEMEDEESES
ncbi:snRNA-activating protein complex subunit 5 [Microcaecilia unicolor]|uniref:snRNA-activating protein complex subunit 5 n=1 Tax=Microcaecilia unicolor TaxID=1415580 RepID=A0A6P7WYV6_9AMPH|nr:snRNA-activating protein complex subunit 5 [Microcaecilia unicolor]